MAEIARLMTLEELVVACPGALQAGLVAQLRALPKLRSLTLGATDTTVAGVAALPVLESLTLTGDLTDAGMAALATAPKLKQLVLPSQTHSYDYMTFTLNTPQRQWITDKGLQHISRIQTLESLTLSNDEVTAAGFAHLARLPRLRTLRAGHCQNLDNAALAALARSPTLETLTICGHRGFKYGNYVPDYNDMGIAMLTRSKSLRHLDVSYSQLTDAGVDHLVHLPRLESLNLLGTSVTDKAVKSLQDMRSLRRLYIAGRGESQINHDDLPGVHIGYSWDW